jgi:hypothetical protein
MKPRAKKRIVRKALREGRIDLDDIKEEIIRGFLRFLGEKGFEDIFVVGEALRDIFYGREPDNIDITVKRELAGTDILDRLAKAIKTTKEDLVKGKAMFFGVPVRYAGPVEDIQENAAPALLQIAVDHAGSLYGHEKPLQDLLKRRANVGGKGSLSAVNILRLLRLKYEYGLKISKEDYELIKRSMREIRDSVFRITPETEAAMRRQITRIVESALIRKVAQGELRRLGIFALFIGRPTLIIGIQHESRMDIESAVGSLKRRYGNINIRVVKVTADITDEWMDNFRATIPANGFAAIIDRSIKDISEIEDYLDALVGKIEAESFAKDSERIASLIEAILKGEEDKAIKIISSLNDAEMDRIIDFISLRLVPIRAINIENELRRISEAIIERGNRTTTIMPSGIMENRPDVAIEIMDSAAGRKESGKRKNILVITDSRIKTQLEKEGYIKTLNENLNKFAGKGIIQRKSTIDIEAVYQVVTYHEMLEETGIEVTRDNAVEGALALARALVSEDLSAEDIVIIGGEDLYKDEIHLAWVIKGVLEGEEEAIKEALKLLKIKEGTINIEHLRGNVIYFGRQRESIEEYKRAVKELKKAL